MEHTSLWHTCAHGPYYYILCVNMSALFDWSRTHASLELEKPIIISPQDTVGNLCWVIGVLHLWMQQISITIIMKQVCVLQTQKRKQLDHCMVGARSQHTCTIIITYFWKMDANSLMNISVIPFWTGINVAISRESASALMIVGPNTIAQFEDIILFTWPISTTLQTHNVMHWKGGCH